MKLAVLAEAITDFAQSRTQDAIVHHAANTAAVAIPAGAAVLHSPDWVVYCTAIAGLVWYGMLILEKSITWARRLQKWFKG